MQPETDAHLISISRVRVLETEEASILRLRGLVRSSTQEDFRSRLSEAGQRSPFLVVDLSELDYLNSAGLGMLLLQARRQKTRSGWLRVVAPSPAVAMILKLAGVDRELPVHPREEEALSDLRARAA